MVKKQKLWFKAKTYGWGWVPATKEGWLVCLVFIVAIILGSVFLLRGEPDTYGPVFMYLLWVSGCTSVLLYLSYKHGEKPRWRWGEKDESE